VNAISHLVAALRTPFPPRSKHAMARLKQRLLRLGPQTLSVQVVSHYPSRGFNSDNSTVWNNNGLLESGGGGPNPNSGNVPCLCSDLGPSPLTTGMGGWSERIDLDWCVSSLCVKL
jgi:hypothetical protein